MEYTHALYIYIYICPSCERDTCRSPHGATGPGGGSALKSNQHADQLQVSLLKQKIGSTSNRCKHKTTRFS